jgi:hypothetical protein
MTEHSCTTCTALKAGRRNFKRLVHGMKFAYIQSEHWLSYKACMSFPSTSDQNSNMLKVFAVFQVGFW